MDQVATMIEKRGLQTPALLFLEMHRPLFHLSSQATIAFTPFLGPLFWLERGQGFGRLLADREGMDLLMNRLEASAAPNGKSKNAIS